MLMLTHRYVSKIFLLQFAIVELEEAMGPKLAVEPLHMLFENMSKYRCPL